MLEWSNEAVFQFLEYYQKEPCLWNPKDKNNKDRIKVTEAWNRISENLQIPVQELKHKKEILMVLFRKHLKKKVNSITLGMEPIYEPSWYAYQTMERFLLPVYTDKNNIPVEVQQSITLEEVFEEIVNDTEEVENILLVPDDNNNRTPPSTPSNSLSYKQISRVCPTPDMKQDKMKPPKNRLTNTSSSSSKHSSEPTGYDECDMYASLLARKLRDLSSDERKIFMYEIDGLFVEKVYKKRCTIDLSFS